MSDQQAVAVAVVLEGATGGMALRTVDLDNEVRRPKEVDGQADHLHVHKRVRKCRAAAQAQEPLLQLRSGQRGADLMAAKQETKGPGAGPPWMPSQGLDQLVRPAEAESLGFVGRSFERPPGNAEPGEIQDGARWGGHRYAVAAADFIRGEGTRAVVDDPRMPPPVLPFDGDVDRLVVGLPDWRDLPEGRRVLVAEHCPISAGEGGRPPSGPLREGCCCDEVDTSMDAAKPAHPLSGAKLLPADARGAQLIERDNPVLPAGELDDRGCRSPGLFPCHETGE